MPLSVKGVSVRDSFQCCCECSVKTGTIIIGWLQLDLSILQLLLCVATLVDVKRLFHDDARGPVIGILVIIGTCLLVNGLLIFSARRGIPVLALPYLLLGLIALAVMCLFIIKGITHVFITPRDIAYLFGNTLLSVIVTTQVAIRLLIEILLLYGSYREEPKLMLPYVVLDPIGVFWVATGIFLWIIYLAGKNIIPCLLVIPIVESLFLGIRAYMWVIVYSYYRQLISKVCVQREIPLQNIDCRENIESGSNMSPDSDQGIVIQFNPHKKYSIVECEKTVHGSDILRVEKKELWPSSREYLL